MSEHEELESQEVAQPQFDEAQLHLAREQIRSEQNLAVGTLAGAFAALIGAAVWAVVTVVTGYQIGWMAIGVGFLVGIAIRTFGKGLDNVFGIIGAVLALVGCLLGNLFTVCGAIAKNENVGFFEILGSLDLQAILDLMIATFSPMDLLFYGFAIYEGYRLSFRQLTEQEIAAQITGRGATS